MTGDLVRGVRACTPRTGPNGRSRCLRTLTAESGGASSSHGRWRPFAGAREGLPLQYGNDDAGRLTGADLANGTSSAWAYDEANRLTNLTHTSIVSGTINSFSYGLDNVGNRTVMTDTEGVTSSPENVPYGVLGGGL